MKRVIIVHGWSGTPEEGWFPWLKSELEKKEFEVLVPQLPNPKTPRIAKWVPYLAETVGTADEDTYFVGHSMGCQTIARCLETLTEGTEIGGAVFVAGFFKRLTKIHEEGEEVIAIAREWLETPLDFQKIKSRLPKSVAVFSDNDYYVPLDNADDFRDKLGSEVIIKKGMGHFSGGDKVFELPVALEGVLKLAGR